MQELSSPGINSQKPDRRPITSHLSEAYRRFLSSLTAYMIFHLESCFNLLYQLTLNILYFHSQEKWKALIYLNLFRLSFLYSKWLSLQEFQKRVVSNIVLKRYAYIRQILKNINYNDKCYNHITYLKCFDILCLILTRF